MCILRVDGPTLPTLYVAFRTLSWWVLVSSFSFCFTASPCPFSSQWFTRLLWSAHQQCFSRWLCKQICRDEEPTQGMLGNAELQSIVIMWMVLFAIFLSLAMAYLKWRGGLLDSWESFLNINQSNSLVCICCLLIEVNLFLEGIHNLLKAFITIVLQINKNPNRN